MPTPPSRGCPPGIRADAHAAALKGCFELALALRISKVAAPTNNSRIENRLRIVNYGSDRLFRGLVCDSIRANATMRIRWHGRRYWRRAVLYSAQESNCRLRLSNAAKTTVGSFPKES